MTDLPHGAPSPASLRGAGHANSNVTMQSADPEAGWGPAYNDCEPPMHPWLFKCLTLHDVTVCLDESQWQ